MNSISNLESVVQTGLVNKTENSNSNSRVSGKTIGKPQLSESGAKYYEQLKNKYGDMDFILVSRDQKENAKANAAAYANPSKTVVLIDEDKIERMATDENYRNQYEGLISNAKSQLASMKEQMAAHSNVQGYGIEVKDDGTTSLFAVLKDSSKKQSERIANKAAEKKAQKKAADKKADKKKAEEQLESRRAKLHAENKIKDHNEDVNDQAEVNRRQEVNGHVGANGQSEAVDHAVNASVVLRANSIEDLMRQIEDYELAALSDNIKTPQEQFVGQNIDFSL